MTRTVTDDPYVTYFRTTLDPLDLYRVEQIVNHGDVVDTSTPASALAAYLVGLNPNLRWCIRDESLSDLVERELAEKTSFMHSPDKDVSASLRYDAAVFSCGTNHTIVMGLRALPLFSRGGGADTGDRKIKISLGSLSSHGVIVGGTSLPIAPWHRIFEPLTDHASSPRRDTVSNAEYLARLSCVSGKNLAVAHVSVSCYSPRLLRGDTAVAADNATAPEVEGFVPVDWDEPTWNLKRRPAVGSNMFSSLHRGAVPDECPAIVSRIHQGADNHPFTSIEVN